VPAEFLNAMMLELCNAILGAGIALDKTKFTQLSQCFQRVTQGGAMTFGVDTGTANAYNVVYAPVITTLTDGMLLWFKAKNANTGASTLNVGAGAKPLMGEGLNALIGAEIPANAWCQVQWSAILGAFVLLQSAGGAMQLPAGSYGTTPAQFDASTKLVTAAFVQRALGNCAGSAGITATGTLNPTDAGKPINVACASAGQTISLPASASVPAGAGYLLSNQGQPYTLSRSGSDTLSADGSIKATFAIPNGTMAVAVSSGGGQWLVGGPGLMSQSGDFTSSKGGNGYQKLPGGLILQWGVGAAVQSPGTNFVSWPVAFPTYFASMSIANANGAGDSFSVSSPGLGGFNFQHSAAGSASSYFLALGW